MGRRRRGLQHMISSKDQLLKACRPTNLTWDQYLEDCESAVNNAELHSDEYSTDDQVLAKQERDNNQRPERIKKPNSVIIIRKKKWRSSRVCKIVVLFLKYNLYFCIIIYIFIRSRRY